MAVVRVGQFVQFRRRLGVNEAGDVEQVAEVLEVDDHGDSYVRLANDVDWYITDHDFRVLTPDELLALDGADPEPEEIDLDVPAPELPEYANQEEVYLILYKEVRTDELHTMTMTNRQEADEQVRWFNNAGNIHRYQVLRTVKFTLGYNL